MPLIDTADALAPEQALVSVVVADTVAEFDTAPRVVVLGRRTANGHIAVTPTVDADGAYTGRFAVMHIPTGIAVTVCRAASRCHEIAALVADLDWASITGPGALPEGFTAAYAERVSQLDADRLDDDFEPTAADRWAEARDGAAVPSRALNLAGWSLDNVQEAWKRTIGDGTHEHDVPLNLPGTESEEHPRGEPNPLWTHWIIRASDMFGVAFLLLVLRRLDAVTADKAAAWLACQWEAGDSVGEWSYDLAKILDEGRADTAEIPTAPPAPGPLLRA